MSKFFDSLSEGYDEWINKIAHDLIRTLKISAVDYGFIIYADTNRTIKLFEWVN